MMKYLKTFEYNEPEIVKRYYDNGNIETMKYILYDKTHREDGPAYQVWYKNGQKQIEIYIINDKYHREDGPAYQEWYKNGQKKCAEYVINGEFHREDGPANESWDENGQKLGEEYYKNSKLHRENGPATLYWTKKGIEEKGYFLYDTYYKREDWLEELKKMNSPHYEEQKKLYELEQDMEKYNL